MDFFRKTNAALVTTLKDDKDLREITIAVLSVGSAIITICGAVMAGSYLGSLPAGIVAGIFLGWIAWYLVMGVYARLIE